jgi:hypothetical protein
MVETDHTATGARLASVLAGVDLTPEAFLATLETALQRIRAVDAGNEMRQFSETDEAELIASGLDLSPRRLHEKRAGQIAAAELIALLVESKPVDETARRMGVNASRVRQMLGDRSLFGMKGDRGWQVPTFQFSGKRPIRGFSVVMRAMPGDIHPIEAWSWLTNPEPDLELHDRPTSPVDWLRSGGDPERAARLATDL